MYSQYVIHSLGKERFYFGVNDQINEMSNSGFLNTLNFQSSSYQFLLYLLILSFSIGVIDITFSRQNFCLVSYNNYSNILMFNE